MYVERHARQPAVRRRRNHRGPVRALQAPRGASNLGAASASRIPAGRTSSYPSPRAETVRAAARRDRRTAISTARSSNLSLPAKTSRYLNASTCLSLLCELRRVQPLVRGDTFTKVVPLLHTLA